MHSAISLRGLTKEFKSAHNQGAASVAVSTVDLEVKENEFLVMVGPSGCGKSTILRLIAGLEEPTSGEVYVGGARMNGLPARDRNVGFMFQGYALFRQMTVAENIGFGLKIERTPASERRRRIEELIALMGLDGLEDRRPDQLSGGQQQRVALARALSRRPKVLLLDEPFGSVDAKVRQRLRADTKKWQRELGIPTILVTHDQREALEMGDRVAVMSEGRFEQIDTPHNVYGSPATPFVGRFIGRANVFQADLGKSWSRLVDDTRLDVMVSPEDISVSPHDNGRPLEDGRVPGTVVGYAFLGRMVRLEVQLTRGGMMTVAVPKQAALADDLSPGKSVAISVGPCRLFPVQPYSTNGQRGSLNNVSDDVDA